MSLQVDEITVSTLHKTAKQLSELSFQIEVYAKALIYVYGECRDHLGLYDNSIDPLVQTLLNDNYIKSLHLLAKTLHQDYLVRLNQLEQGNDFLANHSNCFLGDVLP